MHRISNTSDIKPNWGALAPDDDPSITLSVEATTSGATYVFAAFGGSFNVAFESKEGTFDGVFSPTADTPTVLVTAGQTVNVPPGIGNVGIDDTILPSEPGQSYTVRFQGTSAGTVVTGEHAYTLPIVFELDTIATTFSSFYIELSDPGSAILENVSIDGESQEKTISYPDDIVRFNNLTPNKEYECSIISVTGADGNTKAGNSTPSILYTTPDPLVITATLSNVPYPDGATQLLAEYSTNKAANLTVQLTRSDGHITGIEYPSFSEAGSAFTIFGYVSSGGRGFPLVSDVEYTLTVTGTAPGDEVVVTDTRTTLHELPPLAVNASLTTLPLPEGGTQLTVQYDTNRAASVFWTLTSADGQHTRVDETYGGPTTYSQPIVGLLSGVEYTLVVEAGTADETVVATDVATTLVFPFTVDMLPDEPPRGDTALLFDIGAGVSCTVDYELYVSPRLSDSTPIESGTAELGDPLTKQIRFEEGIIANTSYSCYYVVTAGGVATGRSGVIHTATLEYEHFSPYFQIGSRRNFNGDVGTAFRAVSNITVTSFGRMPMTDGAPLNENISVRLWDATLRQQLIDGGASEAEANQDTSILLATLSVGPSAYQSGTFRYENLTDPIVLLAGRSYVISQLCQVNMADYWFGHPVAVSGGGGIPASVINSSIVVNEGARYSWPANVAGGFPSAVSGSPPANSTWPIVGFLAVD